MAATVREQPPKAPAAEDFRVRAAADKRERMRARLIDATMDAFLDVGPGVQPVIDDVIRAADVSRGSFYKYFNSLDEVLAEIGRNMADEMLTSVDHLFAGVDDAAVRIAAGPLMAMARAAMEPRHAAFIARVDFIEFLASEDPRALIVKQGLSDGRTQGRLKFESLDAAVDLVVGVSLEAARRVLKTRSLDGAYIRETATLVLLGLGLTRKGAERAVADAWQHLQEHSAELHWWKPVSGT
jgi:AcrR family transcriptional regulator